MLGGVGAATTTSSCPLCNGPVIILSALMILCGRFVASLLLSFAGDS